MLPALRPEYGCRSGLPLLQPVSMAFDVSSGFCVLRLVTTGGEVCPYGSVKAILPVRSLHAVCNNGGGRRVGGATVTPQGRDRLQHAQACSNSIYM